MSTPTTLTTTGRSRWWRWRRPRLPSPTVLLEAAFGILALVIFVALGRLYGSPLISTFDEAGLALTRGLRSPQLDQAATLVTSFGSELLWAGWPLATVVLLATHRSPSAVALAVVFLGVHPLNDLLKAFYHRARPLEFGSGAQAFSFPSGHAMAAGAVYSMLALLAWRELRGRSRSAAMLGCLAMALLVAVTRPYLGVHYPSDVLAGLLAGALWTNVVVLLWRLSAHLFARYRLKRFPQTNAEPPAPAPTTL